MRNKSNGFYDNERLNKIDQQIKTHLARPTLVSDLKKQNEKKNAEKTRGLNWQTEWKNYWYVYVFLLISALFTGTLGIYMGLSPQLVDDPAGSYIHFNTDIGHVLLAIVYLIAFVGVTEVAFAIAKWKFFTREESNNKQEWTMIVAMVIAGLSILGTGIAGGTVVASNIAFLSEFVNIPPAAQKWVVVAIPVLIVLYTFLFSIYALASESAATERIMREKERERELDNKTRMDAIRQIAAERLQAAQIEAFERLVEKGLISSAEALAAIEAGRSLHQEEVHLGRDLDGDRAIGTQPIGTQPAAREQNNSSIQEWYTMDAFLNAMGINDISLAQARWTNKTYQQFAQEVSGRLHISGKNMRKLFFELYPEQVHSGNGQRNPQ
ncbi:MAG: hypothetical protein EHM33_01985 [Chloroflexi bacterium]|nr:MAG: hypothetical protein EHM33_01985 [Chloroflexota bacterium]